MDDGTSDLYFLLLLLLLLQQVITIDDNDDGRMVITSLICSSCFGTRASGEYMYQASKVLFANLQTAASDANLRACW
jgi:hypothetical protein